MQSMIWDGRYGDDPETGTRFPYYTTTYTACRKDLLERRAAMERLIEDLPTPPAEAHQA
jgi:hypothetical protein